MGKIITDALFIETVFQVKTTFLNSIILTAFMVVMNKLFVKLLENATHLGKSEFMMRILL